MNKDKCPINVLNVICHEDNCSGFCENIENPKMEQLGWYEFECIECGERFLMAKGRIMIWS